MGETEEGFILGYRKGRDPQYLECDSVEAFEPEWLRIDMENKMAHKTRHARRHLELNCGRPLAGENSTRMQHNRPGGVWAWRVLELSCDPHLMGTIALIFLSRALGGTVSFGLFYTVRYARLIRTCTDQSRTSLAHVPVALRIGRRSSRRSSPNRAGHPNAVELQRRHSQAP